MTAMTAMNGEAALAWVRERGIVLESARGPLPRLTEAIAGEPINGSWWSHPQGRRIFAALRTVAESDEIFVCRLVDGRITFVHRRVLPALVRLADTLPRDRIARIRQVHTASGRHVNEETPYPEWVTPELHAKARTLSVGDARRMLPVLDV